MKKDSYYILINEQGKMYKTLVNGYTFKYKGVHFGITNIDHKTGQKRPYYTLSELSTGLRVCDKELRRDLLKEELLQGTIDKLNKCKFNNAHTVHSFDEITF